jgi:galactokinase
MMIYCIYLLFSPKPDRYYLGCTEDKRILIEQLTQAEIVPPKKVTLAKDLSGINLLRKANEMFFTVIFILLIKTFNILAMYFNKPELESIFYQFFGTATQPLIVRSPGRVNIIGEHTDYNEGFVLPAAIDKAAYLAISLRDDDEIHLVARDLQESFICKISDLKPEKDVTWPNYILGTAAQFIKRGVSLKGFNAVLTSNIPIGAGLSSSAAVECAAVFALNELLQTKLERLTMVHMAQKAEHEYAGVMCGIMDQFASMMGKKDHVIRLDCRSLDYEYEPFHLGNVKVLLLNTNVKHSLASSEYNTRRRECETAVEWVQQHVQGVTSVRNVILPVLFSALMKSPTKKSPASLVPDV